MSLHPEGRRLLDAYRAAATMEKLDPKDFGNVVEAASSYADLREWWRISVDYQGDGFDGWLRRQLADYFR